MIKRFFIIVCILLSILFGFYVYKDSKIAFKRSGNRSYVIQKNMHSTGYENGKKVFDIKITQAKSNQFRELLFAKNIINGNIYNKEGKAIIKHLYGKGARINTLVKTIIATNNIKATIYPSKKNKKIKVLSSGFKYTHKAKKSSFFNETSLTFKDTKITSNSFDFFTDKELLVFHQGFILISNNSTTNTQSSVFDVNKSLIISSKNVVTTYIKTPSKKDSSQISALLSSLTTIKATNMSINFEDDDHPIINYTSHVNVHQPGKYIKSDFLQLNFKKDHFIASSNIKLSFDNLLWSISNDRKIHNEEIKTMLKSNTTIKASHALFDSKQNILTFSKKVTLKQKNFKLSSDIFTYDINQEILVASGNVIIYKYGLKYLNTPKLTIDIKNETFKTASQEELSEITLEI